MEVSFSKLGVYGQLGNQMFQYALLLGIKYKLNARIAIDPEIVKNCYLFEFFDLFSNNTFATVFKIFFL